MIVDSVLSKSAVGFKIETFKVITEFEPLSGGKLLINEVKPSSDCPRAPVFKLKEFCLIIRVTNLF